MQDPAETAGRRAARYWNIDGLAELYIGLFWLCIPLYLYAATHLAKSSPWYKVLIIGGMLAMVAGPLASRWLLSVTKRRLTYPRTGYVACEKPRNPRPYWLALLLVTLLLLPFGPQRLAMPLTGLAFAVIATAVNQRAGLVRVYIFGGFMLCLGVVLGIAGFAVETGLSVMFGAAGAISLLSGGWTLVHYLKRLPEQS